MLELLQGRALTAQADQHTFPTPGRPSPALPPTRPTPTPDRGKGTHIHIVNVQDVRVELEAQRLGLLDRVGQLSVGLQ